jgi:hypothetical protein
MSKDTKKCQFCAEEINVEAIKCRFCGELLNMSSSVTRGNNRPSDAIMTTCPRCQHSIFYGTSVCPMCKSILTTPAVVIIDKNGMALVAFLLSVGGLFFLILAIPAVICGHLGLAMSQRTLNHTGKGLAIAALWIGYLTIIGWLWVMIFWGAVFTRILLSMTQ